MKQSKKRKKRLRDSEKKGVASGPKGQEATHVEHKIPNTVLEAFSSVTLGDGDSCKNPSKAAEARRPVLTLEDQSTTCSSSSGNFDFCSSSSSISNTVEALADTNPQGEFFMKNKPKMKKIVASAGTVSTFLHKDYVRSTPKKGSFKMKNDENLNKEEAEQFLYSVLGDDTILSFAVVSDVFCQCGYNIDKALDILLEISSSSTTCFDSYNESSRGELAEKSNLNNIDTTSGSSNYSSDVESQGDPCFIGNTFSNFSTLPGSGDNRSSTLTGNLESEISHRVLESLFRIPSPKTSERDPDTMNWKDVVKKITSFSHGSQPVEYDLEKLRHAKGREYQVVRESANQHWDSMKSYYQKASTAYSNGDKAYAAYLSEQGRLQKKLAMEAEEKGSQDMFAFRNQGIKNMITIDLHGQHVKQAMKLLKLHLLFGAFVRSVRSFRVITGCGAGKSSLKNSVISLLRNEGIEWCEENQGSLVIRLGDQTSFSLSDTASDSE